MSHNRPVIHSISEHEREIFLSLLEGGNNQGDCFFAWDLREDSRGASDPYLPEDRRQNTEVKRSYGAFQALRVFPH